MSAPHGKPAVEALAMACSVSTAPHGKPAVEALAARPGSGHGVALWLVLALTWLRPGPSHEEAKKALAPPVLVVLMRSGPILHHLMYGLLRHWL